LYDGKPQRRLSHNPVVDFRSGFDDYLFALFLDNLQMDLELISWDHIVSKRNSEDLLELRITREIMAVTYKELCGLVKAFQDENPGHNRRFREMVGKIIFALAHILEERALSSLLHS